jgi:hypothetical protein
MLYGLVVAFCRVVMPHVEFMLHEVRPAESLLYSSVYRRLAACFAVQPCLNCENRSCNQFITQTNRHGNAIQPSMQSKKLFHSKVSEASF